MSVFLHCSPPLHRSVLPSKKLPVPNSRLPLVQQHQRPANSSCSPSFCSHFCAKCCGGGQPEGMEYILTRFKTPVLEICIAGENMENPFFFRVSANYQTIETLKFHLAAGRGFGFLSFFFFLIYRCRSNTSQLPSSLSLPLLSLASLLSLCQAALYTVCVTKQVAEVYS